MIKIGDTVRFLNSTGGGVVSRIDEKKKLVYVEDEDGFEMPALLHEVVVIANISEKTNAPKKDFGSKPKEEVQAFASKERIITEKPKAQPIIETAEGDKLNAFLAFFPIDIKQLQSTAYECYLVNDSNYFLYYNIINGEKNSRKSVAHGEIEPNMQESLCEVSKDELNDWENLQVQIIAFKKDKTYEQQPVTDMNIRINVVKFYKLHSFTENDYFDEPCMMINLVEEQEKEREKQILTQVTAEEIKEALYKKEQPEVKPRIVMNPKKAEIIEIDLHIDSLVDTTAGMDNAAMLQLQLDKFHAVLDENKNRRGQRIVFIHGKGEGVLRKEIEKLLKTKYSKYYFQDASFREYGFGATMVTIR